MQIDMQQEGRHTRLRLSGELTIYDAIPLHRALLDSLGACDELELELGAVTDLDAAGLQQLLLVSREARATGKRLRIIEHSDATRDVLALCRLDPDFGGAAGASAAEGRSEPA